MLKYQIYGSASSKDYDVLVYVDKLGSIQENHELIDVVNEELEILFKSLNKPSKKINANLGVLYNGQVVDVFKGYTFEVNNSCYYTYSNHQQEHGNFVATPYEWTIEMAHYKIKRCFRFILSFYSRIPELRKDIKAALRGDLIKRIEVLQKIDFTYHTEFPGKNELREDIYKTFAFQFAQTHALCNGIQIYSKEDAIKMYFGLENCILRNEITVKDLDYLNSFKSSLIDIAKREIHNMSHFDEKL